MQTKLTLRLDSELIERAKQYADAEGKSVSQIVADFFEAISQRADRPAQGNTPVTASLTGVLPPFVGDARAEYRNYLLEKQA